MSAENWGKFVTLGNMNPNVKAMEYEGPVALRAGAIKKELAEGKKYPFTKVIEANIGDCHASGQHPITYIRQVLALVAYPELMSDPKFPEDVKQRARVILSGCRGNSIGSYSDSPGSETIRKAVAKHIEERDSGVSCNWEDVILYSGAAAGIQSVIKLLKARVNNKKAGVMVPIPLHPLYSASLTELNLHSIPYYLNEGNNWSLELDELNRAYDHSKDHCNPRGIVIINPGNPTGQVLTMENIETIIKFACKRKLFIFADEVYQHNVFDSSSPFHSFKKVLIEMGHPYCNMELASFMSGSKGYMGECGIRGGWCEVINLDPDVMTMLQKSVAAITCPTTFGQTLAYCIANPPKPGEPSYEKYVHERSSVLDSLEKRAKMVEETFNSMPGFSCQTVQGSMYAFPKIAVPPKAIEAAKAKNQDPSTLFAFELLESTGICVVPGSEFGQKDGTFHFRITTLLDPEQLRVMLEDLKQFYLKFLQKYS